MHYTMPQHCLIKYLSSNYKLLHEALNSIDDHIHIDCNYITQFDSSLLALLLSVIDKHADNKQISISSYPEAVVTIAKNTGIYDIIHPYLTY